MKGDIDGYTFYAHNLGRFDSVFILKSLVTNKYFSLIPIWKDNSLIKLTIVYNKKKINLLDSYRLIPNNLENILESFKCSIKKGKFPYNFVNKNNLNYVGDKPLKEFFDNTSYSDYSLIKKPNWNLKKEVLNYLKSDLSGLFEALLKFNENIFNQYNLNITKFKTLLGLALAVYRSNYLPNHLTKELKMIKGELEREIRSAYFGGNVGVYINKINKGYLYDVNSQYSKAMLNDMPIGNPILSLETNLEKIFGFVYGEITCPDENILQIPFIQHRGYFGKTKPCPRGKFKRLIFS